LRAPAPCSLAWLHTMALPYLRPPACWPRSPASRVSSLPCAPRESTQWSLCGTTKFRRTGATTDSWAPLEPIPLLRPRANPILLLTLLLIFLALAQHLYPSPMDIPRGEAYLLWYVQRTEYRCAKIGSPPGDARPDGIESSRRARAAAWLWHRPPDRASEPACSAIE